MLRQFFRRGSRRAATPFNPSMPRDAPSLPDAPVTEPMFWRRAAFLALALGMAAGLLSLALYVLSGGGWSLWEWLILAVYTLNLPWLALAGATGLAGLYVVIRRAVMPEPKCTTTTTNLPTTLPTTLLAVCCRDEDMATVLPPLHALWRGLDVPATIAILSDTSDPRRAAIEAAAVAALAATLPPGSVRYRRRADNTGWKAGNVMDFLDHHSEGHAFLLLLDADSVMSPDLVSRMVRQMAAQPRLGLLQANVAGHGAVTRFAHWFGVGHAPGAGVWVAGQNSWQGPQGGFWGHNALLRIAPFRRHCRLDPLPNGQHILSHDFVEAARLQAAGWEVRILPVEDGSWERHPPDLLASLDRDRRWAAGNMQYRFLLRDARLSRLGRFQMVQAMLHYGLAPLWFALLPLAVLNATMGGAEGTPLGALLAWLALSYAALHLPRLAGHARLVTRHSWPALLDAVRESAFMILFEGIMALDKTLIVLSQALGRTRPSWPAQQREGRRLGWAEACRYLWPHMLAGGGLLAVLVTGGSSFAVLAALPALAGLLLAVPFCVMTARCR